MMQKHAKISVFWHFFPLKQRFFLVSKDSYFPIGYNKNSRHLKLEKEYK